MDFAFMMCNEQMISFVTTKTRKSMKIANCSACSSVPVECPIQTCSFCHSLKDCFFKMLVAIPCSALVYQPHSPRPTRLSWVSLVGQRVRRRREGTSIITASYGARRASSWPHMVAHIAFDMAIYMGRYMDNDQQPPWLSILCQGLQLLFLTIMI